MPFSSKHPLHPSYLQPWVRDHTGTGAYSSHSHGKGKDKGKAHGRSDSNHASTSSAPHHPHPHSVAASYSSASGSDPTSPSSSGFHLSSLPRVGRAPSSSSFPAHTSIHPDSHHYFSSTLSSALPSANNSSSNLADTLNAPPSFNYNTITDIQNRNASTSSSTPMGFRDHSRHEREHKDKHHHDSHSKEKPHLDIILDAPFLTLRGTGPDVEPTTLSGHVALFLTEATSVKEITLQFRGKAKIPMPATESLINSGTSITYVVCNHDWSFLEGDKRHARTLKAGRHFFPFHLEISGTLPSSISTPALGGASVAYKLRAVATRPGFLGSLQHSTLQAVAPVTILRAFTPEALEYQQTLEIENTWPEKLMYSLMLPHKAWAAGDELAAVIKFSPLRKGVRVMELETALWQTVKVYARSGAQEEARKICSVKHGIVAGKAVEIDWGEGGHHHHAAGARSGSTSSTGTQRAPSRPGTQHSAPTALSDLNQLSSEPANYPSGLGSSSSSNPASANQNSTFNMSSDYHYDEEAEYENADVVSFVKLRIPHSAGAPVNGGNQHGITSFPGSPAGDTASSYFASIDSAAAPPPCNNANGAACHHPDKHSLVPTPSHTLDPIIVSHRVRWSILIRNNDGHTSELRCSLPVIILDSRVLEEARSISIPTRRLMMGSVGLRLNGEERRQQRRWWRAQRHGSTSTDVHAQADEDEFDDDSDGDGEDFNLGFARATDDGSGALVIGGTASSPDAPAGALVGMHAGDDDRELPSYTAHVRDRVANMFLPEAVTMRVSNPWVGRVGPGTSPGGVMTPPLSPAPDGAGNDDGMDVIHTADSSGRNSTSDLPPMASLVDAVHAIISGHSTPGGISAGASQPHSLVNSPLVRAQRHLPPEPGPEGDLTPLDWVNSELLLSLSDEPVRRLTRSTPGTPGGAGATAVLTAAGLGIENGVPAFTAPPPAAPAAGSGSASPHVGSHVHLPNASSVRGTPPQPQYVASIHGGSGSVTTGRRTGSRWGSRAGSRANSRTNSPERGPASAAGSRRPSAEMLRPVSPALGGFGGLAMSPAHATPAASETPSSAHSRSRVNSMTSPGHLGLPVAPGLTPDGSILSPGGSSGGSSPSASGLFQPSESGGQSLSRPTSAGDSLSSVDKHDKHHHHGHGGRHLHSLFKATMKPFSALAGHRHHVHEHDRDKERDARAHGHVVHAQRSAETHHAEPSREASPVDANEGAHANATHNVPAAIVIPSNPYATQSASALPTGGSIPPLHSPLPHAALSSPGLLPTFIPPLTTGAHSATSQFAAQMLNTPASISGPAILHRAFTEVPDYSIASRGFLGGVPPLDSMRGLPSYEEAARESRSPGTRSGTHSRTGSDSAASAIQSATPEPAVGSVRVEVQSTGS